jgi:hypothetical protein
MAVICFMGKPDMELERTQCMREARARSLRTPPCAPLAFGAPGIARSASRQSTAATGE